MNDQGTLDSNWTHGICEVNGINIHFLRTGGNKPSVVALHGLTGNGACWTPLAGFLEEEFDVVMLDARGHGKSSAPASGYLYPDHARDVQGVIEALSLKCPVVLGHSMGGMTAVVSASQAGADISGVVLVDPTFISPQWQQEVFESDVADQHRQFLSMDRTALLAQARQRHPHRSNEMIEIVTRARLQTHLQAFEVLTPPNPDFWALIRAISAPILMVLGDRGVVSIETAQELQRLHPRLSFEVIPDAGHGLPYDQPERLGTAVKTFLRSLSQTEERHS